jgi:hypothetical protein
MLPPGLEAIRQQLRAGGFSASSSAAGAVLRELEYLDTDQVIQDRLKKIPTLPPGPVGGPSGRCTLCGCDPATCP